MELVMPPLMELVMPPQESAKREGLALTLLGTVWCECKNNRYAHRSK